VAPVVGRPNTLGSRIQAATQSAPQPAPRATTNGNAPPASARKIGHRPIHPTIAGIGPSIHPSIGPSICYFTMFPTQL
jgi:hypothetical protein